MVDLGKVVKSTKSCEKSTKKKKKGRFKKQENLMKVANEVVFGGKDKLKTVYFAVLDQLSKQLEMRHSGYVNIYYKFKFFINIDNKSIDNDDIVQGAKKLRQFYETDIDENTFTQECIHFKTYMQNATEKKQQNQSLLTYFRNQNLEELFPNVSIALVIYSCMAVTNCSTERSFRVSKELKHIYKIYYWRKSVK